MKKEGPLNAESEFDKLLAARKAAGWHYVGREGLTQTKFSDEAKFEEVPYQTEDAIKDRYLKETRQQDPSSEFEVDLVLDENTDMLRRFREILTEEEYQNIVTNLRDVDRTYFVFVRKVVQ
ncbi:MAG: hypothetical protein A3B31_02215 [Candidatus Komeilibacteria bacterium RIFCSPLOWO2_01_FULL_53_11]|uniref:Uncharacterized protein n=1 Tax=Candidatus Komeilibacteria bacterium RIFCSPLOWO2_01_FULL_53_11 TaxID=1798552 RepID=A0A1G2BTY2_9BACT|nr:MAG: hypothetical protein A3B31_02215 [Candidatus Komeilibacteria bacterium RIFCSPLOWO2_01_FULL_53_11]